MVTFWFVTVNGLDVAGPLSWEGADKRREWEKAYRRRANVQLSSVTVFKCQAGLVR